MSADTEGTAEPYSIKQEASVYAYQLFTTQNHRFLASALSKIRSKMFSQHLCVRILDILQNLEWLVCVWAQFMGSLCDSIKTVWEVEAIHPLWFWLWWESLSLVTCSHKPAVPLAWRINNSTESWQGSCRSPEGKQHPYIWVMRMHLHKTSW